MSNAFVPSHWSVTIENPAGTGRAVILCDHASNYIPERFASLGLSGPELERHIAWDPGALGVSRSLARHLNAPLVAGNVSRLVIDCNRDPTVFDSIAEASEDTPIPGNLRLSPEDRAWRVREIYEPFHGAIRSVLARRKQAALIGMHSFTPVYRGIARPWHIGILFDRDRSLADPLLEALRRDRDLPVGENEPYSPQDRVYHTLDRHGQSQGLASVMIEIRNDLIATAEAQEAWGRRLAEAFKPILGVA